jgi:hypothetical protein
VLGQSLRRVGAVGKGAGAGVSLARDLSGFCSS